MTSERNLARMQAVPIMALRNSVLFPMSVVPVNVGRPRSVHLVEELMDQTDALVGVVTQRNAETVEPTFEDLYELGTLARIVKVIRLGAANYSVVLNGISRFRVISPVGLEPYMRAEVERLSDFEKPNAALASLGERLRNMAREVLGLLPDLPRETASILDNVRDPGALADLIASNLPEEHASIATRQQVLETTSLAERISVVTSLVERQLRILKAKKAIALEELGKSQRDLVLRQQLRSVRDELGESTEDEDLDELRDRVERAEMPEEADRAARKQLRRLAAMPPQSAEYQVGRSYVEWLADLPWSRVTPERVDVAEVRRCLEEDHYGLERVKKRIVEFSAVRQLRKDKKGPILLFIGPPGVGKTSLGRSIARSMGRKYGRISLGGVRDEAEIRGHRRTYVGALPGRIIQALKKVGTKNPVLVLDEVDKMGVDMRGDPAAALLEVLDPEQNTTFTDHYIDLPFDLSQVLFLATANYWGGIPEALRDRLEVIEVPGYTRNEKLGIAVQFLVPKQLREHGLSEARLRFVRDGLEHIIDFHTREAGVRGLEREIAAVCRAITVRLADGLPVENVEVDHHLVRELLGPDKVMPEIAERKLMPGVATGLALSSTGGDLQFVEATLMPGRGEVRLTGSLGNVLREAAETAVAYVRSRADRLGLQPDWLDKKDLHVHVPRARASIDSASSGLAIFVAVASLLLRHNTLPSVALVGELTLRGSVLPVEGVKDMLLAAHRAKVGTVVMPAANERDIEEVPAEIRADLEIKLVHNVSEVLPLVLDPNPATEERPRDEFDASADEQSSAPAAPSGSVEP
jgi:ATP-dependent Lon protease